MNYTTVMYLLIGAGVVCFTTAVILFFALHIPAVFGELTGRTAKKEIARLARRISGLCEFRIESCHSLKQQSEFINQLSSEEKFEK